MVWCLVKKHRDNFTFYLIWTERKLRIKIDIPYLGGLINVINEVLKKKRNPILNTTLNVEDTKHSVRQKASCSLVVILKYFRLSLRLNARSAVDCFWVMAPRRLRFEDGTVRTSETLAIQPTSICHHPDAGSVIVWFGKLYISRKVPTYESSMHMKIKLDKNIFKYYKQNKMTAINYKRSKYHCMLKF
jgi:hypothetical protein